MKKNNHILGFFGLILGLGILGGGIYAVYNYQANKERYNLAKRIAEYGPRKGVPRTIEDLQRAIAEYEDIQVQHVKAAAQTGTYWKILGSRFQDRGMNIEALKALEEAVNYNPSDETLHYLSGINAAYAAKSMHDYRPDGESGPKAAAYFAQSEAAYLRAVELAEDYTQARYGLANLYAFELNKPEEAIYHLLRYMDNRSGDADAMFILARSYYMTGRLHEALDWYDRGISQTKDESKKAEARANRQSIEAMLR